MDTWLKKNKMGHHYVPQEYLRGFEDPDNPGKIWMYDKLSKQFAHASIKNVVQEAGYYNEETEKKLSMLVEGPANKALKKLRQGVPINGDDRLRLAIYIATMFMRVPRRRRKALELLPGVREDVINRATAFITHWAQTSDADPELKAKRLAELERDSKKLRSQFPAEAVNRLRSPWAYKEVLILIANMAWRIVSSENAGFFLTSDNPAHYFDAYGLGNPQSELTFPIASNLVLLGSWQGTHQATIRARARPSLVKEVNRRIASGAERFIFYHRREGWIPELAGKQNPRLSRIKW